MKNTEATIKSNGKVELVKKCVVCGATLLVEEWEIQKDRHEMCGWIYTQELRFQEMERQQMAGMRGREREAYDAGRLAGFSEALELITLRTAAGRIGTTPDNLRGAIARDTLKATKIGRDWLVAPEEVERYRRENRRGAKS